MLERFLTYGLAFLMSINPTLDISEFSDKLGESEQISNSAVIIDEESTDSGNFGIDTSYIFSDISDYSSTVTTVDVADVLLQIDDLDTGISSGFSRDVQVTKLAIDNGYFSEYSINTTLSAVNIVDELLEACDLFVYNTGLWDDTKYFGTIQVNEDVLNSALNYGLLDGMTVVNWNEPMAYSQYAILLDNIESSTELDNKPYIVSHFPIEFVKSSERIVNYTYLAVDEISDEILKKFIELHWTFTVVGSIADVRPGYEDYTNASGLTDTDTKEIFVKADFQGVDGNTVRHELGHFAHETYPAGALKYVDFLEEKEGLASLLRSYSVSSKYEAFADLFSYCYHNYDNPLALNRMYKAAPKCTAFVMDNYVTPFME